MKTFKMKAGIHIRPGNQMTYHNVPIILVMFLLKAMLLLNKLQSTLDWRWITW